MADAAGFDMLELHMAHGYLLASFISPLTNLRTDAYGGLLELRLRYPLEVFDAVRAAWPAGKPISVKISATDWAPGGTTADDAVRIAARLRAHGCDAVTVSTGQTVPHQKPVYGRLYQTPFSDRIRHEAGIPTMTVGNLSTYADANSILAAGRADLCVLARGHLYDPVLDAPRRPRSGRRSPWPDQYLSVKSYTPRRARLRAVRGAIGSTTLARGRRAAPPRGPRARVGDVLPEHLGRRRHGSPDGQAHAPRRELAGLLLPAGVHGIAERRPHGAGPVRVRAVGAAGAPPRGRVVAACSRSASTCWRGACTTRRRRG